MNALLAFVLICIALPVLIDVIMRLPSRRKRWASEIERDARRAPMNFCGGDCGQCGGSCAEEQRRWDKRA